MVVVKYEEKESVHKFALKREWFPRTKTLYVLTFVKYNTII